MKKLKIILCLTLAVAAMLTLSACSKTELYPEQDLNVVFSGLDGQGTARIGFPDDGTPTYADGLASDNMMADFALAAALDSAIKYEVYPNENLSNGDEVTVTITVDKDKLAEHDLKAKESTHKFTVEGLTEIVEIDAFENFEIKCMGISPQAEIEYPQTQEFDNNVVIRYRNENPKDYYKDGDTIEITATKERGGEEYVLEEATKTFTIECPDYYIESAEEITDETMQKMYDKIEAYFEKEKLDWETPSWSPKIGNIEFQGYEFWLSTDPIYYNMEINKIMFYYKINAWEYETEEPIEAYYCISFSNIINYEDGTQEVDVSNYKSYEETGSWSLSLDTTYKSLNSIKSTLEIEHGRGYEITEYFE